MCLELSGRSFDFLDWQAAAGYNPAVTATLLGDGSSTPALLALTTSRCKRWVHWTHPVYSMILP